MTEAIDFSLPNLALNRPATQSSVSHWSRGKTASEDARHGVNGDLTKEYGFHTDYDESPWWMVDLGEPARVRFVRIFNRDNVMVLRRASPLLVEVSDSGERWTSIFQTSPGRVFTGHSGGRPLVLRVDYADPVRFLRLRIPHRECLHLSEVEIYGEPSAPTGPVTVFRASGPVVSEPGAVATGAEEGTAGLAHEIWPPSEGGPLCSGARSAQEIFAELVPFLDAADSPLERRERSRAFDERIAPFLNARAMALPAINCFYEVLAEPADHRALIAATSSMRAMGHPVRVWTYSPDKLDSLLGHGVEIRPADEVVPRGLFQKILAGAEIRYLSDIFRYAVLYEHGGLWMDSDVVLLRPFPFCGDYFFNLQWRGGNIGHFLCGNVMYGEPYSRHFRALYELSIDRFFNSEGRGFGDIGPKLLSDYIASDAGAELRQWVFGPMFFNPIDWLEIDRFQWPVAALSDYLNDERVFGIHLWTARNVARPSDERAPLISVLSDPLANLRRLTDLADWFDTDKNRRTGNRHAYARVYDRLLSSRRFALRRIMEVGLRQVLSASHQNVPPSVALWQSYFPFCEVIGVDPTDFSGLHDKRFTSFICHPSEPEELRAVASKLEPSSLDVIIDDGSHASVDQQLSLREFFPLLTEGGWYFIEDLDWQPPGEDAGAIATTKNLLREIKDFGTARTLDPFDVSRLAGEFAEILFFDSHYEVDRARLLGGLVAIRKRGGSGLTLH